MGAPFSVPEWDTGPGVDEPDTRFEDGTASSSPARTGYVPPPPRALPGAPSSSWPLAQEPPWADPPFDAYFPTIMGNLSVLDSGDGNNLYGIITCRQLNAQVIGGTAMITTLIPDNGQTDNAPTLQNTLNSFPALGLGFAIVPAATSAYGLGSQVTIPPGVGIRGQGNYGVRNPAPTVPAAGQWYGTAFMPAFSWNALNPAALFLVSHESALEYLTVCGTAQTVNISGCNASSSTTVTTSASLIGVTQGAYVTFISGTGSIPTGTFVTAVGAGQVTLNTAVSLTGATLAFTCMTSWCTTSNGTAANTGGQQFFNVSFLGCAAHQANDGGANWSQDANYDRCTFNNTWPSTLPAADTYVQTAAFNNNGYNVSGFNSTGTPTFKLTGNFGPGSGFIIPVGCAVLDYTTANATTKVPNSVYTTALPVLAGDGNTYVTVAYQAGIAAPSFTSGSLLFPYKRGIRSSSSDQRWNNMKFQYSGVIIQGDDTNVGISHLTEPLPAPGPNNIPVSSGGGTATLTLGANPLGSVSTAGIVPGACVYDTNNVLPLGTYVVSLSQSAGTITLNTTTTTGTGNLSFYSSANIIHDAGKLNFLTGCTIDSGNGNVAYLLRLRGSISITGVCLNANQLGTPPPQTAAQRPVVLDPGIDTAQGAALTLTFPPQSNAIGMPALFRYLGTAGNANDMVTGTRIPANVLPAGNTVAALAQGQPFIGIFRGSMVGGLPFPDAPPLQATSTPSGVTGYTLINGTGIVCTWTAPNDNNLHRVMIGALLHVTSNETGGLIQVSITAPDSGTVNLQLQAGGQLAGYNQNSMIIQIAPGTAVAVKQTSALTGGAAVLWADIWGQ